MTANLTDEYFRVKQPLKNGVLLVNHHLPLRCNIIYEPRLNQANVYIC